jgi:hypothetical protein
VLLAAPPAHLARAAPIQLRCQEPSYRFNLSDPATGWEEIKKKKKEKIEEEDGWEEAAAKEQMKLKKQHRRK